MNTLRETLDEYLQLRRAAGFRLEVQGALLNRFVEFAEAEHASHITRDLAMRWATQPKNCQPAQWAKRLNLVRRFAVYRHAVDPDTEPLSPDLLPHRFSRKQPYIYSSDQIEQLINAAENLRSPTGLRASTFSTLFGLLATTGMRVGEAIALDSDDIDLVQGLLTVRRGKFGKSRLVPLHPSTQAMLKQYAVIRESVFKTPRTASFFLSRSGGRLSRSSVKSTFVLLSRKIGFRKSSDRRGPRIHDLRHSYAVRVLSLLYRTRDNVEPHIASLATYLGHTNVLNTYWYLTATPELLHLASQRLEKLEMTP